MSNIENEMLPQFHQWFEKEFGFGKEEILLTNDERGKALLGAAWLAWQASRQALVIDIEPDEPEEGATYLHQDFVRARIESQGVKCK